MSTRKPKQEPSLRGWVRGSPGFPVDVQIAVIKAAGVKEKMIYGAAKHETIDDMIDGLVTGDVLVVHGSHRLGATMADYTAALDALRKKRITLRDTERGTELTARELTAVAVLAADRKVILGGRIDSAGVRRHLPGRLPPDEAKAAWFDMRFRTDKEAADHAKWGKKTMYETFGKSGRSQGRRKQE